MASIGFSLLVFFLSVGANSNINLAAFNGVSFVVPKSQMCCLEIAKKLKECRRSRRFSNPIVTFLDADGHSRTVHFTSSDL